MKIRNVIQIGTTHRFSPILLSVAGLVAVVVGVQQGLLHVAPGYQGAINASEEVFGRREWLLAGVGVVGVIGAAFSIRRKQLTVIPVTAGGIVLFEAFRSVIVAATSLPYPLFTETTYRRSDDPVMFILGAEPFLLIAAGILLIGAGVISRRRRQNRDPDDELSTSPSATT